MPAISKGTGISKALKKAAEAKRPLWQGPEQDGITFSLLSRFLCCRERFRLMVVEGWKARETFSAPLEFGNMWHACEEAAASEVRHFEGELRGIDTSLWTDKLNGYCDALQMRFPFDREKIEHWRSVTAALFPIYVDHWYKHPDVENRRPLLQEQVFDVPYKLPSGRTVKLRGKWDSVDLVGGKAVWLQENKTKSQLDGRKIERQLRFDLQTMMYLVSLVMSQVELKPKGRGMTDRFPAGSIKGVRYNVVRRSAHKSVESMLKKLEEDRADGRIGEWFGRWNVEVSAQDVARFRRECLDPILEQLCDWWDMMLTYAPGVVRRDRSIDPFSCGLHWRHPFGVYNVLDEGGSSDFDEFLETGNAVGLQRCDNLFPELT